tara:strand:- start:345 stop:467 length:123 start_codon:yes stop_codon:yes gene_type:complete
MLDSILDSIIITAAEIGYFVFMVAAQAVAFFVQAVQSFMQ